MEKRRNYTPPKGCALRSAESPLQGADDFRSLLQSYRGSYTSPTLPCGSYPFVNLWEANTLLRKLFTSRKSEKNVRQHSGTQKGAIEAITSIHTGYMIRAPTFRRSTQRQNPHPLQLNTAAPQQFKQRGDAAAEHRRLFSCPKPKTNNFYRRKAAESEEIIWHFSTAQ